MIPERSRDITLFLFVFFSSMIWLLCPIGCRREKMSKGRASQIFREYVLDPIPESVENIRIDQPGLLYGRTYTLRFNINKNDLDLLIKSRPFVKIWNVKYKNGSLDWHWDRGEGPYGIPKHGHSIALYGDTRQPSWFRPELVNNPNAYGFYKIRNLVNTQILGQDVNKLQGRETIQVLLYDEKENTAYFIAVDHPR